MQKWEKMVKVIKESSRTQLDSNRCCVSLFYSYDLILLCLRAVTQQALPSCCMSSHNVLIFTLPYAFVSSLVLFTPHRVSDLLPDCFHLFCVKHLIRLSIYNM